MPAAQPNKDSLHQFAVALAGSGVLRWLSIVSGTLSLISLGARTFEVGLSGVFVDVVTYFRMVADAVFGWLPSILLNVDIPQGISDLWTLSFMGTGALHYARRRLVGTAAEPSLSVALNFIGTALIMGGVAYFVLALIAVPFLLFQYGISFFTRREVRWTGSDAAYQETASWIIISVGFAVIFFALNAFAPSL